MLPFAVPAVVAFIGPVHYRMPERWSRFTQPDYRRTSLRWLSLLLAAAVVLQVALGTVLSAPTSAVVLSTLLIALVPVGFITACLLRRQNVSTQEYPSR